MSGQTDASATSGQNRQAHDIAIGKDEGRSSRLRVGNFLEEKVRKEWKKMALSACDDVIRKYWVCRNEQGLMVIFKCRGELNEMNSCLKSWNADQQNYEEYKNKRLPELKEQFANGQPNPEYFNPDGTPKAETPMTKR
eukprot:gb/GECG01013660.1/.p1 GENE.gb/GECG01013660.1/~~gb/GECG01013660.1/.p1  ORF type:complete len:138 (+),score=17.14 gb/GECG01013660.1/:1-414(+)